MLMCLLLWCWMCGWRNRFRKSKTGVTGWLGMKDSNPVGEFAFSDPVSWHSLPTDHPPSPYSSSQSPVNTRHQSMLHLHISQQINSVAHSPCRELSNALCGPPSVSPSSILPPTQQYIQLQPASHSSFIDSCHASVSKLPELDSPQLQRNPCSHWHATMLEPRGGVQHVFCIHTGSNLIEYSPFRSMYVYKMSWAEWVSISYIALFCSTFPQAGTGFPNTVSWREFPDLPLKPRLHRLILPCIVSLLCLSITLIIHRI